MDKKEIKEITTYQKTDNLQEDIHETESIYSKEVKSNKLKQYIIKNIVQPNYINDIRNTMEWRIKWLKISRSFRWIANFFLFCSALLASLQTVYETKWLSIGVIGCNTIVFLFQQFSTEAKSESKASTNEVNKYFEALGIEDIPEITNQEPDFSQVKPTYSIEQINKKSSATENTPLLHI